MSLFQRIFSYFQTNSSALNLYSSRSMYITTQSLFVFQSITIKSSGNSYVVNYCCYYYYTPVSAERCVPFGVVPFVVRVSWPSEWPRFLRLLDGVTWISHPPYIFLWKLENAFAMASSTSWSRILEYTLTFRSKKLVGNKEETFARSM